MDAVGGMQRGAADGGVALSEPPGRVCILVLCGLPGAGKSSLASELVETAAGTWGGSGGGGGDSDALHAVHCCFDNYLPRRLIRAAVGALLCGHWAGPSTMRRLYFRHPRHSRSGTAARLPLLLSAPFPG